MSTWPNVYMKIMRALYKQFSEIDFKVLTREAVLEWILPCKKVSEAVVSQSKREFIAKLNISLKEANESEYWLGLLQQTVYIGENSDILDECRSIIRIQTSIIKSTNNNMPSKQL